MAVEYGSAEYAGDKTYQIDDVNHFFKRYSICSRGIVTAPDYNSLNYVGNDAQPELAAIDEVYEQQTQYCTFGFNSYVFHLFEFDTGGFINSGTLYYTGKYSGGTSHNIYIWSDTGWSVLDTTTGVDVNYEIALSNDNLTEATEGGKAYFMVSSTGGNPGGVFSDYIKLKIDGISNAEYGTAEYGVPVYG